MGEEKYYSIGEGWWSLIEFFEQACELAGVRLVDFKEKFGSLRLSFYSMDDDGNPVDQESWDMLLTLERLVEKESQKICEFCGKPGKNRTDLSWMKTLCDEHYNERLK